MFGINGNTLFGGILIAIIVGALVVNATGTSQIIDAGAKGVNTFAGTVITGR